jgi:uridylate kinase
LEDSARIGASDGTGLSELGPVKRIVLKLSGESLAGENGYGIDPASLDWTASSVVEAVDAGAEIAIVVGGGNIFRGSHVAAELGIEGATADYMSMLGTVINAMALQAALEGPGRGDARPDGHRDPGGSGALHPPPRDAPPREGPRRDLRRRNRQPVLHDGHRRRLRALEIGADALLMAKNRVDGVYDKDPRGTPTPCGWTG